MAAERARLLIEQAEALGEAPEDPLLLFFGPPQQTTHYKKRASPAFARHLIECGASCGCERAVDRLQ